MTETLKRSAREQNQNGIDNFAKRIMEGILHTLSLSFTYIVPSPLFLLLSFPFSIPWVKDNKVILGVLSIFTTRLHCYHPSSTLPSNLFWRPSASLTRLKMFYMKSFKKRQQVVQTQPAMWGLTDVFKDPRASWICCKGLKVLENRAHGEFVVVQWGLCKSMACEE